MPRLTYRYLPIVVATAAAAVGGTAIAGAATPSATSTTPQAHVAAGTLPPGGPAGGLPPGGPGRGAPMNLSAIAKALDVTTAQLQSALDASRPSTPPAGQGADGGPAADIAKALGVAAADVQAVLDANRPDPASTPPSPGTPPDQSKLISALAAKFNLSESAVKSALDSVRQAHDADRTAHEDAMYAAVAKALGKSTADVKAAFEANCPPRPPAGAPAVG